MLPTFPSEAQARHEEGFLNSADHLRLFWQRYTPSTARATVAVLHGGGDHGGRYPALTSALVQAGFQVALVDLRGHGQSDGRRWHVDAFQDNLSDFDAFVAKLSQDGVAGDELFVVGHSHGALVAALWGMTRGRHVSGFVLSSPYFRLALRPPAAKVLMARLVGRVVPWLPLDAGLDLGTLTSDEEFQAPLLVLAGGEDRIADVAAARAFVDAAGSKDKRIVVYEGFRHEIFNEVRRAEPIGEAVAWLSAHISRAGPLT